MPPICETLAGFPRNIFQMPMRVRILYHDHCFDGAASAAFFSRFVEEKFYPGAEFSFTGLAHKASQLFEPEHVRRRRKRHRRLQILHRPAPHLVVRSSPERVPLARRRRAFPPRHQRPQDFRSRRFAPAPSTSPPWRGRSSASIPATWRSLVAWADIVDGALYKDAQEAVDLRHAGHAADAGDRGLQGLGDGAEDHSHDAAPLAGEIAADPEIQAVYQPLYQNHSALDRRHSRAVAL